MLRRAAKKSDRALDADAGDLSELFGIEVEPALAKTKKRPAAKMAIDRDKSGRRPTLSVSGKKPTKSDLKSVTENSSKIVPGKKLKVSEGRSKIRHKSK
jgi:hypothetical protein